MGMFKISGQSVEGAQVSSMHASGEFEGEKKIGALAMSVDTSPFHTALGTVAHVTTLQTQLDSAYPYANSLDLGTGGVSTGLDLRPRSSMVSKS